MKIYTYSLHSGVFMDMLESVVPKIDNCMAFEENIYEPYASDIKMSISMLSFIPLSVSSGTSSSF